MIINSNFKIEISGSFKNKNHYQLLLKQLFRESNTVAFTNATFILDSFLQSYEQHGKGE